MKHHLNMGLQTPFVTNAKELFGFQERIPSITANRVDTIFVKTVLDLQ